MYKCAAQYLIEHYREFWRVYNECRSASSVWSLRALRYGGQIWRKEHSMTFERSEIRCQGYDISTSIEPFVRFIPVCDDWWLVFSAPKCQAHITRWADQKREAAKGDTSGAICRHTHALNSWKKLNLPSNSTSSTKRWCPRLPSGRGLDMQDRVASQGGRKDHIQTINK